jgi:tRNA (guanine-N7-)-methyltransferase
MTQGPSISTTSTPLSPSASASTAAVVPGAYQNISGIRANTMKFLPNFFRRHQLHSIFICFPDPHFKTRKHKARIVSETLNAEYAYVLRPGGKVYTITDVEELHRWMVRHFEAGDEEEEEEDEGGGAKTAIREMWERLTEEELAADPCVKVMMEETEEGKKVTKNNGPKFVAVWRRKEDPPWPLAASVSLDMS